MATKDQNEGPEEDEIELPEGLDLMKGGGWGEKLTNWIKENFSSVILPIIALLILGGGIYLYSQNQAQVTPPVGEENATGTEEVALEDESEQEEGDELDEEATDETQQEQDTETPAEEPTEETEQDKIMGGPDQGYTITADQGEGITHLARQALKEHLSEQDNAPELTPEHKIYIEDYLQNQKGSHGLETGDQLEFSADSISDAIEASQNLTDSQLDNLTQYANQAPSLNY